jgi:hypothetical protein
LWRKPDELPPPFPPWHGRIGPGGRDFIVFHGPGTIADANGACSGSAGKPKPASLNKPDRHAASGWKPDAAQ